MVKTDSNDGPGTDGKKLLDQTFPLRADMAETALVRRLMEAGAVSGQNFTLVRDGLLSAIVCALRSSLFSRAVEGPASTIPNCNKLAVNWQ